MTENGELAAQEAAWRNEIMGAEMAEQLQAHTEVTKITDGIGYGDGSISYKEASEVVGLEKIQKAVEVIESDVILVDVSTDSDGNMIQDDGCGDGREAGTILYGHEEIDKPSLHRAKVFDGGATMGMAARIGVSGIVADTLNQEFANTMTDLDDKLIGYGAHTDEHAHGENCGCGAIDKAPTIITNAIKYKDEIAKTIDALGIPTDGLDAVFNRFESTLTKISGQEYSGKQVSQDIKGHDKITKVLRDDHKEMFIILNMTAGKTVNQEAVRQATDGDVQVFATDVWRLKEIAEKMYPDNQQDQVAAFLGELVYTLATAATLTDGTLPVYAAEQTEFALAH